METKVIKLDANRVDEARIRDAAALIDAGGLVAFPTETVYGIACRVESESLARLDELKGRTADKYYTLHIGRKGNVDNYVPTIGLKARKLINDAWPGPLTIVFALDETDIEQQRGNLEADVFESLYRDNSIGIRCPDNAVASALLQQSKSAVVAPSANVTGRPPASDSHEVLAQLAGQIELLLDAGPCKYKESSTVVKIDKSRMEVLRAGAFSEQQLHDLSKINFLFVCTGNTCRSPMAEGIFRKYLAEKLRCDVDDLGSVGYKVNSAGIMGSAAFPATAEAIEACAVEGIDITAHRNKGLSKELIDESDFIFAMERLHLERVVALEPEAGDKCFLLAEPNGIPDPIGHPQEYYDSCARTITAAVRRRLDELVT
ncbi:MAG: L-threonylcarbamoyladenylate synthase [Planctomycetota bacterium]